MERVVSMAELYISMQRGIEKKQTRIKSNHVPMAGYRKSKKATCHFIQYLTKKTFHVLEKSCIWRICEEPSHPGSSIQLLVPAHPTKAVLSTISRMYSHQRCSHISNFTYIQRMAPIFSPAKTVATVRIRRHQQKFLSWSQTKSTCRSYPQDKFSNGCK